MNPRAIISDPKVKLVLTFNGEKSQKGYNEVEMLAVDKNVEPTKWQASSIRLIDGELKLAHNEAKCSKCHGQNIRPIWENYPEWPTLYGSLDDFMPRPENPGKNGYQYEDDFSAYLDGDGEYRINDNKISDAIKDRKNYLKFRDYAKTHPRYSILEKSSDESNPVYPYTQNYRDRNEAFRPNLLIGNVLAVVQADILFKRISKDIQFKKYKNMVTYIDNCEIDEKHYTNLVSLLNAEKNKKLIPKYLGHQVLTGLGIDFYELTLRFISADILGPKDPLSHSGRFGIPSLVQQRIDKSNYIFQDHLFKPDGLYIQNVYYDLENVVKERPYTTYFKSKYLGQEFHNYLNSRAFFTDYSTVLREYEGAQERYERGIDLCKSLKADYLKESKHLQESSILNENIPSVLRKDECAACHDSGQDSVASHIPFNNPESWSMERRQSLWNGIKYMTKSDLKPAHEGGLRMPLGGRPMNEEELQALKNYLLKP